MRYLLDTCTFLWWMEGAPDIPARVRRILVDRDQPLYLGVVSSWEVALKHRLGRLALPGDPPEFIPQARSLHDIDALPLVEHSVLRESDLPAIHGDPFDRMLVCQAQDLGLTLLTPDAEIHAYDLPVLW